MAKRRYEPPPIEIKRFTIQEIEQGIRKLNRRIEEIKKLKDDKVSFDDARVDNAETNIRETIREVFSQNSPEFQNHQHHNIWHGGYNMMDDEYIRQSKFEAGIPQTITMLKGLITRLEEKCKEMGENIEKGEVSKDFWADIHVKITSVAKSRFESTYYADAAESAFKEVNTCVKDIVKRKTGKELDGAPLMKTAFSPNNPLIVLGDLSTESGRNIQQGYMEIFAGAMMGIRNPKAHDNLNITEKRAKHFIYLASLLMQKIDERI